MFLKEFAITRYGPFSSRGVKRLGPFTLFLAPNEEGKTLTIDALLKMMFSDRELKPLEGLRRVEEKPEGYLVAATAQEEWKLPEAGRLSTLFNVSALEFRNIFLIRDSDLALAAEDEIYRGVAGRLTGMRIEEIKTIKENLQELGGITAGGDFSNTAPEKLKDRYTRAKGLLGEIESLLEELEAESFSRFEENMARLKEQYREVKVLLDRYDKAYSRERYEKGREAVTGLREALDKLARLDRFNRDDYEDWQRAESNRDYICEETRRLEKEKAEKKEQLQKALEQREQVTNKVKELEYRSRQVKEKIEPELDLYAQRLGENKKEEALLDASFTRKTVMASTLAFFIALVGTLIRAEWWLLIILFGSLSIPLVYGFFRFRSGRKKAGLERLAAEIRAEAERIELPSGDVKSVRAAAGRVSRELELGREAFETAEREVRWQEREIERLRKELRELYGKIRREEDRMSEISSSAGIETLSRYRSGLEEKQALKGEIERQKSILQSHFGPPEDDFGLENLLRYWKEQVKQIEIFAGAAAELSYDQVAVDELKNELSRLDSEINRLDKKMARRSDQLRSLDKEINSLFPEEDSYLPCQTTVDLEAARLKVKQWLENRERCRDRALWALEVLNHVAAGEEQKVSALFGADNPVSEYFEDITGGRYREVLYDSGENRVKVRTRDGLILDSRSLSGGAYDQLYFSIRLALGESILRGGKGFFILDDPFIKADGDRLKKMLGMLGAISLEGWQVIYFSAKDEVRAALEEDIEAGKVKVCMI